MSQLPQVSPEPGGGTLELEERWPLAPRPEGAQGKVRINLSRSLEAQGIQLQAGAF